MASGTSDSTGSSSSTPATSGVPMAIPVVNFGKLFSSTLIPLAVKLDQNNFFLWRSQVLPAVRAHDLEGFLNGTRLPPPELIPAGW